LLSVGSAEARLEQRQIHVLHSMHLDDHCRREILESHELGWPNRCDGDPLAVNERIQYPRAIGAALPAFIAWADRALAQAEGPAYHRIPLGRALTPNEAVGLASKGASKAAQLAGRRDE
jgi:hypothetical protein